MKGQRGDLAGGRSVGPAEKGNPIRTIHYVAGAFCCLLLFACASREDRQWRDLQTILEQQDTR